jgi:Nucleotidyl transferase AbiEii toxin, Type IV TA system
MLLIDEIEKNYPHQTIFRLINKFDVLQNIKTSPLDVLYSQKLYALFNRKKPKGRDFFDILFLSNKAAPNFEYLDLKLGISDGAQLKAYLDKGCQSINFDEIINDVRPFLFNPKDVEKIKLFPQWVESLSV